MNIIMDLSDFIRQIEEENNKFWEPFFEQWEKDGGELADMLAEITKETDNLLLDIQYLNLNIL